MKKSKLFILILGIVAILSSCSSSSDSKFINAYDNARKELESASNEDDCRKIHDQLYEELIKVGKEERASLKDITKSAKVWDAYKEWEHAFEEKCKSLDSNIWFFMTLLEPKVIKKHVDNQVGDDGNEEDEEKDDSGESSGRAIKAINELEEFIEKLESTYSIHEDELKELDEEFEEINSKYADIDEDDFSSSDFRKIKKLRKRFEKEVKRLNKLMN
jgi:hypothetical protein